jgi:hypothetical protein
MIFKEGGRGERDRAAVFGTSPRIPAQNRMETTETKTVEQIIKEALAQAGLQQAQPVKTTVTGAGYGDAQTQTGGSDLIMVLLPYSCQFDGKWLNWFEGTMIPDGSAAFNALVEKVKAQGKPLNLKASTSQGGGYGRK